MKKGFTLIELLAVIVILAIIALIVTPVVSNIVANARIASNARSVEGHIKNVEIAIISRAFRAESTGDMDAFDNITQGSVIEEELTRTEGDNVTCGAYKIEHGKVVNAYLCNDVDNKWNKVYNYDYTDGASVIEFKGTYVANETNDTHKGIIYMDPTDLTKECTASTSVTSSSTGCKRFYIFNDETDSYKLIMDRNLGTNIAWVNKDDYLLSGGTEAEYGTDGNNSKGAITINNALRERTSGWIGNPRHIKVTELRTISGYSSTSSFYFGSNGSTTYSSQSDEQKARQRSYHWLFDYTASCTSYGGKTNLSSTNGYWLSSTSGTTKAWYTTRTGRVTTVIVATSNLGIRPVIEIPKALIG